MNLSFYRAFSFLGKRKWTLSSIFFAEKSTLRRPSYLVLWQTKNPKNLTSDFNTLCSSVHESHSRRHSVLPTLKVVLSYSQGSTFVPYPIVLISLVFLAYFWIFVNCRVLKVPIVVKTGNLNWVASIDWCFRADPLSVKSFLFLVIG